MPRLHKKLMDQHQKDDEISVDHDSRLSKRLCYLLRYGAMKEGLTVHEGGYVKFDEVMTLNLMRHNTPEEVLAEIDQSLSHRGAKRFERKVHDGEIYIRACFCVNFEANPCHSGTQVHTLLDTCLDYVSDNLDMYDLQDFPDEFLVNNMIHRLKKKKKLNNAALRQLIVPTLQQLNLDNVYLTEGTLKLIWRSCPYLKVLSLKDCGYLITDNLMEQTVKKLPNLESLNLCACKHLTDRTTKALCRLKNLKELNLSWITAISESAIIDLVIKCETLQHLDIYDHKISPCGIETLTEVAKGRNLTIVLKGLTHPEVAPKNPCSLLPNFGYTFH